MQIDPFSALQKLAQTYREKYDGELLELDADKNDLTDLARQALAEEIKRRGLDKETVPSAALPRSLNSDAVLALADDESGETVEKSSGAHHFTWKTLLCECDEGVKVWQVQAALKEAGIESWLEGSKYKSAFDLTNPRILVAADQLEAARALIAQPIPEKILEESKMDEPEYELPVCPKCGADDPVLEAVDPVNSWHCESCGANWNDALDEQVADSK